MTQEQSVAPQEGLVTPGGGEGATAGAADAPEAAERRITEGAATVTAAHGAEPPAGHQPPPPGAPPGSWGTGGPGDEMPAYGGHGGPGNPGGPGGDGPGGPVGPWGAPSFPSPPPERKRAGGLVAAVVAAALLAGGLGGGIGFWAAERSESSASTTIPAASGGNVDRAPDSVAGIAAKALPSVVTIQADGDSSTGTGTGFVYDKQGHILTNNHVVASATNGGDLTATFSNGKKYTAEVIGRAEGYDIAVLKLRNASGANLTPLPVGNSEEVQVGDATIAIGAPYGLSGTVTTGIVSAKNRPVASSDGQGSRASYMSALQTDASINPGNSGGPLLSADGAVIGVNSAIQSAGGNGLGQSQAGSIGLGFAIPINQAQRVAKTLIETGEPVYAVIGVQVDLASQVEGARVADGGADGAAITPDGPADRAGLQPGDVITKLNDTVIDSGPTLISEIWTHEPGDQVKITYQRDGQQKTVDLTLDSRQGDE